MTPYSKIRTAMALTLTYGAVVLLSAIIDTAFFSFRTIDVSASATTYYTDYRSLWQALPTVVGALIAASLLGQQSRFGYYIVLSLATLATLIHSLNLWLFAPQTLSVLTNNPFSFDSLSLSLAFPLLVLAILFVLSASIALLILPRSVRAKFI
jgi:hypothetical protein